MGSPEPTNTYNPFTDVAEKDFFYKPVLWAKEKEITAGKTATTFEPYSPCTRGQIMTFLWKAMGSPTVGSTVNPFTDVKTGDYYYKPVLWAKDKEITSGTSATTFGAGNSCTRAQAMTFLYKTDQQNTSGQPGTQTVLKVAFSQGADRPQYAALQKTSEDLSAATEGRYKLDVFPGGVLGLETDAIEQVRNGLLDMAVIGNNVISTYGPDFDFLSTPYLFESMEHQQAVFSSGESAMGALYSTTEENDFVVLSSFTAEMCNIYTRDRAVKTPSDLAGMRIRTPKNEISISTMNAIGATPVPLAYSELYTALQIGVIDGAEEPLTSYVNASQYEVAPYYNLTNHLAIPDHLVISADVLSLMSSKDQLALRKVCKDAISYYYEALEKSGEAAKAEAENLGVNIVETDVASFRAYCGDIISNAAGKSEVTKDLYAFISASKAVDRY